MKTKPLSKSVRAAQRQARNARTINSLGMIILIGTVIYLMLP